MTEHTVDILGYEDRAGDPSRHIPDSTIAFLEVKPPISVGDQFSTVVLGAVPNGVLLAEVVSTNDSTILMAGSGEYRDTVDRRKTRINKMAERVLRLVNNPSEAAKMMGELEFYFSPAADNFADDNV